MSHYKVTFITLNFTNHEPRLHTHHSNHSIFGYVLFKANGSCTHTDYGGAYTITAYSHFGYLHHNQLKISA